jgi:adenylate cyclase
MMSEGERRLAAIMFTDMVGFTTLTQKNESLALELLDDQRKLVRPVLSKHRGREVKTIGDAFLVEFPSALEAVKCAIEIQSALKQANLQQPADKQIVLRIGIHLGDVIHSERDVAGDAVNVASRIEPLAPPGGICVSAQVQNSVANKIEAQFVNLGSQDLKNVMTPVEVYQITGYGERVNRTVQVRATQASERIAVLPFANISRDQADDYFSDGMTEELISSISRTQGLRVIARTSIMKYKGTNKSISEIGKELNVGSVLEGSVRKAGEKLRINVKLVETSNEEPRWSHEYDREVRDVFAIQTDIAEQVSKALRIEVLGSSKMEENKPTDSTEAYMDYLWGRQFWNKRTDEDLRKAVEFFQKALELDANYAQAYTGLADSYAVLALLEFMAPNEVYPKAKEAVGRALSLAPQLAEAHTSLGLIRFQYDWDWKGAEEEFVEAISIKPSYAPAHHFFADYLKAMGRFDEALAEIKKARELDPLSLAISTGVGHVLYLSRNYDEAIKQYTKAVELEPNFMATHLWFGRPYLEKGMYKEAISELETAVRLSGESTVALAMLGHGLASAGRLEEATRVLEKLKERSKSQYVPSYWIAVVYNGFRDKEQTLRWMKKAFDERSSWLVWSNVEPRFAWLRADPEFAALMKSMKFP